ncbi:Nudix hydrolase 15, mitochondrial [Wickerhamiella sorbophila]|uniref:Nudix hydrolase 15, mitochondrial n=1 Tax=Wickerhamiella sorbophila TaxID=45607 RepID=A0A2T0FIC0_9ASCO|nr:Nudix hydrolase 15, mitochondrial [Wickerhamiella sorbophila]PRT54716.1 Nudix hydrolase 15, mitochondrial [Wickerhamiella sorbophila]
MSDRSDQLWSVIPRKRLAATLMILFDGPEEKEVVLTVRSLSLRSYPGEVSLPGGKVDGSEDWWETALREANEEIGFSTHNFNVERVVAMPAHLSRHLLFVRPCVINVTRKDGKPVRLSDIAAKLNASEVLCAFSVPLSTFLTDSFFDSEPAETVWSGSSWYFYVFGFEKNNWIFANVQDENKISRTAVTGLTAHMLVDCARYIYKRDPDFPHLPELGYLVGVEHALNTGQFMSRI